ncbi:MAG: helix-turn-helix transcriptional regulator [Kiritimatiellae bacterium]|nr:helix-turn-helix transcriptional regulator [Kiritimatiellia bacterium]
MTSTLHYTVDLTRLSPEVHLARRAVNETGINIPTRVIPDYEFVHILAGSGSFRILDRDIRYGPGDLLTTPPWVRHSYSSPHRCEYQFVHLDFYPETHARRTANQRVEDGIRKLKIATQHFDIPLCCRRMPREIEQCFDNVIAIAPAFDIADFPLYHVRLKRETLRLLEALFGVFLRRKQKGVLHRSIDYIDQHLPERIPIGTLARLERLSKCHYVVKFKKHYGITPNAYITRRRMTLAKNLLENTPLRVADVALRCGYEDPYYFSRVFKKQERMNPSAYRLLLHDRLGLDAQPV